MATERMKLYMDEHLARSVTEALRRRGVQVLTAQDVGRLSAPDDAQLRYAAAQGRVMVTQDADYLRLHAAGAQHAGIAYAPQRTAVGYMTRRLLVLVDTIPPEQMRNHVEFL